VEQSRKRPLKKVGRVCPVCFADSGECLYSQQFHLYEGHCLPDAYDVVACCRCGCVYADTPATQKEYNRFYSEFSKYVDVVSPGGRGHSYDEDKYERTVCDLEKLGLDRNASILDIGCAKGGLLATFKLHGYHNLTGLDPSPECVKLVEAQGIHAVQGGLFGENFPRTALSGAFDCVIVSHVIEHVYDVTTALKNAISLVKTGGLFYLEVPDASRYTRYYVAPYHYFDLEHINHFDAHAMNHLMSRYACEPVACGQKDLQHSNVVYYPAVYGLYGKKGECEKSCILKPDFSARENVIRYIEMSRQADDWPELEGLAKTQEEIIVWGAGAYALRLLRVSRLRECRIAGFVDNALKMRGAKLTKTIKIGLPQDFLPHFKGPIVVCSAVYNNEIVKEIEGMGGGWRVIVLR
jgi:2-polyprenyl-3-methyl-5-hydroxy-6-metoxy-1,4-benzoquinol methylase